MATVWRRAMTYLGLGPDEEYDDYDEVEHLTEVVFREMPEPRTPEEEIADAPWFHVGAHDVFPEEFPRFLGLPANLKQALLDVHGDLFTCRFWHDMQARQRAGEIVDFFPYPASRRLDAARA